MYKLVFTDQTSNDKEFFVKKPSINDITKSCNDWVKDGEWGDAGASVPIYWTLFKKDKEVQSGKLTVMIEPKHRNLIAEVAKEIHDCCGLDLKDHEWKNTCVRSLGGTKMLNINICTRCGLKQELISFGSQRNAYESDQYVYSGTHTD